MSEPVKSQVQSLIEALDAAGIPSTVTYLTRKQIKKWNKARGKTAMWLLAREEERKRTDEWLKKYPMKFKEMVFA
jgi:hypothetical protein